MQTLFDQNEHVNLPLSITEVLGFAADMEKRGQYSASKAKGLENALKQFVQVLAPEEPQDPAAILGNINDIARRWGIKLRANPGTIQTYTSRAKRLLQDYLSYMEDPAAFKTSAPKATQKKATQKREREREQADAPLAAATTAQATAPEQAPGKATLRAFHLHLPGGRMLSGTVPDGFHHDDLLRLVIHLAPMAEDFSMDAFREFFFRSGGKGTTSDIATY